MRQIVIIGAGISGLALAYRLQQRSPAAEITILEEGARAGGTMRTEQSEGFRIEAGPNGFLDIKPSTIQLCHDLGIGDGLIAASASASNNRYLFVDGKLKRLPNTLGTFLRGDLLTWRGKLSLLLERIRRNKPKCPDESIASFARRRAGKEVADVLADAMVTGIFAGDPSMLSARACLPRLIALERQYGSVLRGMAKSAKKRRREARAQGVHFQRPGKMWSFREGLQTLIDGLCARLRKEPILGAAVRSVRQSQDGAKPRWIIQTSDQRQWSADVVVLACPAYRQAALVHELDRQLSQEMGNIPYNRIAVAALGFRRSDIPVSLDGFGYIAPQKTRRDLLGVQWCSSIFPERAPKGRVLLRALCGGWHRPDVAAWEDERLVDAVRSELRSALGVTAEPVFHHIIRWHRAIPQYHLGHQERVRNIEERLRRHPGLFVGGNAYHGVAINDCTEQGSVLAQKVMEYLATAHLHSNL